jgi:hypothetical protein
MAGAARTASCPSARNREPSATNDWTSPRDPTVSSSALIVLLTVHDMDLQYVTD